MSHVLTIYILGSIMAYPAFMLDRSIARTSPATFFDHRDALLAVLIWPVLLLATAVSPVWVAAYRYFNRHSIRRARRGAGKVSHSLSLRDVLRGTSAKAIKRDF